MIYFIQQGDDGPVKIGWVSGLNARSVSNRLAQLQGANPIKLRIIGFCNGDEKEEQRLHHGMRKYRISGEWFALNDELIRIIKELSSTIDPQRMLYDETISADGLAKMIHDEYGWDIYYKDLIWFITTNNKIPFYKVFGKKRYKYKECRKIICDTFFLKKERFGKLRRNDDRHARGMERDFFISQGERKDGDSLP